MRAQSFLLETLSHFVRGDDAPPPGVPARVDAGFETSLAATCVEQRIAPIVSRSLERLALAPSISPVTAARLRTHARELQAESQRGSELLARIASRFAQGGVEHLVCGEALSASFYESPSMRHAATLDVLIDPRDTARALELAAEEGFAYPGVHPVFGGGRIGGRISQRRASELLTYHHYFAPLVIWSAEGVAMRLRYQVPDIGPPDLDDRVWERAFTVSIAGQDCHALSLEDHLLDTAVVAGATSLAELLWVVDLGVLLQRHGVAVDWEYLAARARLSGVYDAVRYAICCACGLMTMPGVEDRLEGGGMLRHLLASVWWRPDMIDYGDLPAPRAGRFRYGLLWCGGAIARAKWLWRHAVPRRRWVRNRTGARPGPWSWLKFLMVVHDTGGWPRPSRSRAGNAHDNVYPIGVPRRRQ